MFNILIADNQILTREGIKTILAGIVDIRITGYAHTAKELLQRAMTLKPQVVVIDPSYSHLLGIDDIMALRDLFPDIYVLVLTNRQEKSKVIDLINIGIKNYVFKECSPDELVNAIYATANGEQFFCKNTFETLFGNKLIPEKNDKIDVLSERETEIIHLVAAGNTNKEIAEKLFLSIHTVKTHRKNIIRKIGFTFKNATDLVQYTGS